MWKRIGYIILIYIVLIIVLEIFPDTISIYENVIKWILSFGGWGILFILSAIISIFFD